MASSGTYAYAPDVAECVEESFERVGISPKQLTAEHARSARRSLKGLFSKWSGRGIRLFQVDEQTQTVTTSDPSYTVASGSMAMLECFIRRDGFDTPVHKISREQYAGIPDKTAEGLPSMVYFDRAADTYYLWNVPENSTDVLHYFRLRRIQDVSTGQETPDIQYHWIEALFSGLAAMLAVKFAPDRIVMLKAQAEEDFREAKQEDRERADTSISMGN